MNDQRRPMFNFNVRGKLNRATLFHQCQNENCFNSNCLDQITYSKLTVHATTYAKINIKGNINIAFNTIAKKIRQGLSLITIKNRFKMARGEKDLRINYQSRMLRVLKRYTRQY